MKIIRKMFEINLSSPYKGSCCRIRTTMKISYYGTEISVVSSGSNENDVY
ncbi:hypothetical protein [Clostridium pasteurianum]|nr:hypothetical protein [Clostridium pasteurianum]